MSDKSQMSVKTKKILLGTGIVFGTLLVFVVSFFLSFSLIINPISFSAFDSNDVATENEELKTQVQTLEDEVEYLNATVEKYKNNVNTPAPQTVDTPASTTPTEPVKGPSTTTSAETSAVEETKPNADSNHTGDEVNAEATDGEEFTPDTVTTPEGGIKPEVEPDITVIDISE